VAERMIQSNPDKEYVIIKWDVDGFKVVNELFGTQIGDRVLLCLTKIIKENTGTYGIAAREERDHFVSCMEKDVFFMNMPELMDLLENGMTDVGVNYPVYIHIGIYEIEDRNVPLNTMCNRAEMALQTIKDSYVKRYAFYDEKMRQEMLEEQELAGQMKDALDEGQFFINLQPVYSVATGLPVSAEALVRWRHPEKGVISPGKFIPLSEKNGFIMKLDRFVWEEVCKMLADFRSRGIKTMPISINVSRVNFYSTDLCEFLMGLLKKYNLESSCLKLEVTESAYTENSQQMLTAMETLQKNGFKIMMDDFGSGYSSLNMLKNVLVDVLKIDMMFIRNLEVSERASNILAYVVRMAKALNMEIVAEGVETENQRDFLGHCGCDCIQGFYYSKPLDIADYEALLCSREVVENLTRPLDDRRTILVVDDMEISRTAVVCNLEEDYHIIEAENGKEALNILKEKSQMVDLVITDISMPIMDGFELLDRMKASPVLSHIPAVVITAASETEDEISALERGAIDVIEKPFDPYEIKQRVKNLVRLVEAENIKYEFSFK
ncbi:MAG: EAL domain-containing protein, partial [Lachnospiraceae bacterium]|nr:EAL domain-containing protein [Lachnospiraceae bacterium]